MDEAERLHVVGVGAHPDDVAVGAGGLIASYARRGHRATIVSVTYGETVRPPGPEQKAAALTGTRPIFGAAGQAAMVETVQVVNRFWGLRCGTRYAEPLYQTWGSMSLARLTRHRDRVAELPLLDA